MTKIGALIACQWTNVAPDFGTQTCDPSPTITCFHSTCMCMAPDGTFLGAFADAGVGDCLGNLSLCP